jgi:hypothetical protein
MLLAWYSMKDSPWRGLVLNANDASIPLAPFLKMISHFPQTSSKLAIFNLHAASPILMHLPSPLCHYLEHDALVLEKYLWILLEGTKKIPGRMFVV